MNIGNILKNSFKDPKIKDTLMSAVGTTVGQIGGSVIGDGLHSGIGDTFGKLGGIASSIPGPIGMIGGAALGVLGGVTNKLFGSKLNQENINSVNNTINQLNSFQSNANNYDDLANTWGTTALGTSFDNNYIGKNGIFNHSASKLANQLRDKMNYANSFVQNSLVNNANNISNNTMSTLDANYSAYGGHLNSSDFTNGVIFVNEGGTHEENPYGGIMIGIDKQGTPNMVEEGEAIFNDYVFSNRIKVPKTIRKKFKLGGTNKTTFADAAKSVSKESEERPNDPISKAGLEDSMMKLMLAQEVTKQKNKMRNRQQQNIFATGGGLGIYPDIRSRTYQDEPFINTGESVLAPFSSNLDKPANPLDYSNIYSEPLFGFNKTLTLKSKPLPLTQTSKKISPVFNVKVSASPSTLKGSVRNNRLEPTWMRYAPVFATGTFSLTDALGLTNKPNYSDANAVLNAARNAGTYKPVSYKPIGNYLTYTPFDRDYYINKGNALSGATRRNLMDTAGNSRALAASLLAADYNSVDKLGELAKTAEEYNLKQRQSVEDFNRATNQANSQGMLQADMANQSALANARNSYLSGIYNYANLREKERQAAIAARSANLTNFINSLGAIGKENYSRNMITSDPSKYYSINNEGNIEYKKAYYDLPIDQQRFITNSIIKHSLGGFLG